MYLSRAASSFTPSISKTVGASTARRLSDILPSSSTAFRDMRSKPGDRFSARALSFSTSTRPTDIPTPECADSTSQSPTLSTQTPETPLIDSKRTQPTSEGAKPKEETAQTEDIVRVKTLPQEPSEKPKASKVVDVVVTSATGGISAGVLMAILTKKPVQGEKSDVVVRDVIGFSRTDPKKMEAARPRVETTVDGMGTPRQTLYLSNKDFPNFQWAHKSQAKDIPKDAILIEGGSSLHTVEQLQPFKDGKHDVVTVGNGLNHGPRIEKIGPGLVGHQGIAWFNGKDHPDRQGGKYISEGKSARFEVIAKNPEFAKMFSSIWNSGVVRLVMLEPSEGRDAALKKAVANSCLNPLGIISGEKMRKMLGRPGFQPLMRAICNEGAAVAKAAGANIGSGEDLFKYAFNLAEESTKVEDFHTSSYAPFAAGQKTELEFVTGELAAIGKSLGVPAPLNDALNQIVQDMEIERSAQVNGKPKYESDDAFRADPVQKTKQARTINHLFDLAGVKLT